MPAVNAPMFAMSPEEIAGFCRRNHIRKLSLFGSILTERFRPESDIDILVEFESGHGPTMFGIIEMEMELTERLGRKVDLRTAEELSRYFRDKVIANAEPRYERA
jgi:predicted nucleotidyltransferase